MFKPLLRVMPSLTGNIKLVCQVNDVKQIDETVYESYVQYGQLMPLSSKLFSKNIEISLLNSSYEWDVVSFYRTYPQYFYESLYEYDKNDLQMYDRLKSNKNRNYDFEFGAVRIDRSVYGKPLEFFAPIYIESTNDIPDYFELIFKIKNSIYEITKSLRINIKNNLTNSANYLGRYIYDYSKKIDDNVIFINKSENKAYYSGINVNKGGINTLEDEYIEFILNNQNTIVNFDNIICKGFERHKLVLKQVLPLSFHLDPNDLLTELELNNFYDSIMQISGYYVKDGERSDYYDFEHNYVNYSPKILSLNTENGMDNYLYPYPTRNIMNIGYPSLKESLFYKYRFTNKMIPNISRWKLKYSSEEYPYVTNMSPAFSMYQDSIVSYGEFPKLYSNITGIVSKRKNSLNLILPLDNGKNWYFESAINKYDKIRNNYSSTWFETFTSLDDIVVKCVDVIDNKCMFNGILYNLNYLYNAESNKNLKIDKFGVFLKINFNVVNDNNVMNDIFYAKNIILKQNGKYSFNLNCHTNDNVLSNAGNELFILNDDILSDQITHNEIFVKSKDNNGDFINLYDYGIDWYKINKYYRTQDLLKYLDIQYWIPIENFSYYGYDIIPIYYASNITELSNDLYFSKDRSAKAKITSELDIDKSTNIYEYSFYRRNKFISYQSLVSHMSDLLFSYYSQRYGGSYLPEYIQNEIVSNDIEKLTDKLENISTYQFNPTLTKQSGDIYATNVFTSSNEPSPRFYGDEVPTNEIDNDIDFIYVDSHNLNEIIKHYNETWLKNDEKLDELTEDNVNHITSVNGFCKFLNISHLMYFLIELSSTYNNETTAIEAIDDIYIRRKIIQSDSSVVNSLIPIKNILYFESLNNENKTKQEIITDILTTVKSNILYNSDNNTFYLKELSLMKDIDLNKTEKLYTYIDGEYTENPQLLYYALPTIDGYIQFDVDTFGDGSLYVDSDGIFKSELCEFDLVYSRQMIKIDNNLWRLINLEETYKAPYKDLYLYELEQNYEFNGCLKIVNQDLPDFCKSSNVIFKPLFNLVTIENKEDSKIYTEYYINAITKTKYIDENNNEYTFYRHNKPNINIMYDISWLDKNSCITINDKEYIFENSNIDNSNNEYSYLFNTYDKYSKNNADFINYSSIQTKQVLSYVEPEYSERTVYNMSYYSPERFANIWPNEFNKFENESSNVIDNTYYKFTDYTTLTTIYGYLDSFNETYISDYTYHYDNIEEYVSHDDLELYDKYKLSTYIYKTDNETSTYGFYIIDVNFDNTTNSLYMTTKDNEYIKYLSYINDVDIIEDPEYAINNYRKLMPFIKNYPLSNLFTYSNIIQYPDLCNIDLKYYPHKVELNDKLAYYDILYNDLEKNTIKLERYFDNIQPYITKKFNIKPYMLKFKDNKKAFESVCFTNEVFYDQEVSINRYPGVRVYDVNNEYRVEKDIEYKFFNDNKFINLKSDLSYTFNSLLTDTEVETYQKIEETFLIFKKIINENHKLTTLTDEQIEWAFSKYNIRFETTPELSNALTNKKLYSFIIKFELK